MKCTYCGGTDFYEGPSGGMSINVLCANPKCRHWFNGVLGDLQDLDRVEPTDEEKEQQRKNREGMINLGLPRMLVKIEDIYQEGRKLFVSGDPARSCFQEKVGFGEAHSNILRLLGWLDEAFNRGDR